MLRGHCPAAMRGFDVHVELFMCCSLGAEQWALIALLQSAGGKERKLMIWEQSVIRQLSSEITGEAMF